MQLHVHLHLCYLFSGIKNVGLELPTKTQRFFSPFPACKASYFNIFDTKLNVFLQMPKGNANALSEFASSHLVILVLFIFKGLK